MSTIREVAELAGVSQATVSRVMSGEVPVTESTRQRVESAMQALDYAPNAFARSLASNRSQGVGLMISHLGGPFMGRMMVTLEDRLRAYDKSLLVASGRSDPERERETVRFLLARRCDGMLLHADGMGDDELAALAERLPVVILNRLVPRLAEQCVHIDNVAGGYQATRHLIGHGHRAIACITGPLWKQDATQRLMGYRRAMAEAHLAVDSDCVIEGDSTEAGGRRAVDRLEARGVACTAVVAGNDEMAVGAMARLRELGRRIPGDISVIGYDDEAYAHHLTPGLTTIHAPIEEMAEAAAARLLELTYELPWQGPLVFRPWLVERGTVAGRRD
ncbi:LacI family transcriptional regulator [Kushneria sinocarnis]|uniref:LacI family transcriptional regulator n=1 Tax=Kushneria sinocarnis TaxID=595502 RepID=A0A420X1G6_9GAMM|nr:LacI family DNA-binding transcriptional regulator [Kushneria sinocarnis]RKR07652.1 LacI family transcriptional regulator [Kushneria sinocarnis]